MHRGKGKWIKHFLFISFTILLALTNMILKYNVILVMVLPIILTARYYNKRFTLAVCIFTSLLFIISNALFIHIEQQDINTYNLIFPKGNFNHNRLIIKRSNFKF